MCSTISLSSFSQLATSEEYKLLHRLNQVTIAKYQDMTALAGRLNEVSQRLNEKCKFIHSLFSSPVLQALVIFRGGYSY